MFSSKKNKINKKFLGAKTVDVPKTAQKTIPFQEAYENGLFLNYDGSYSLIFSFENIDYSLYRDEEKQEVYKKYTQLMNSIPTDIKLQEFIMNTDIDADILRETLMPFSQDYPEISDDYRKIMGDVISGSTEAGAKKIMLMALSYKPTGKIDNANVLFKCYQDLQQLFSSLGSTTKQLFPEEVFEILYKFYHQFSEVPFMLPKNAYGSRIKNYVTPAYFRFGKHEIEIGDQLTRVLFIKEYSTYVDDEMINDIIDNSEKITVSKQITRIAKSQAMDMLQKKIFALELTIQKRMEQNHKNGGDYIPFRLSDERKTLNDLQERLGGSDCELFEVTIMIAVSAKTKEELEDLTMHIRQTIGAKHQLQIETLGGQQAKALRAVLPFAQLPFNKRSDNKISFSMLSDAAGVLIPFSHIEHFVKSGIYYGKNLVTNNVIALDRTAEMNSNGFVLATSGAGKSMFSKAEMFDVLLKFPNDEVIVIDPEREYEPLVKEFDGTILKIAPNSPTKLNVFDIDLNSGEEGQSAIATKAEFIMTICETVKGSELTSNERTLIDRCVKETYREFITSHGDMSKIPTFTDFYKNLVAMPEIEAKNLALSLELYITGSFNIFSGRTNINTDKRFLVFDISSMGEQIRPVGLQVVLEYVWQRVSRNRDNGIRTWVWIDEFSIMFNDGAGKTTHRSGEFFAKVYKRIRKYGGVPTAITQNITEVLTSTQAKTMLLNSEFVVLLQQRKEDLDTLQKLFSLSPSQESYLKTGKKGSGLIVCGRKIIPFEKPIPTDSLMYKICTTKFGEN